MNEPQDGWGTMSSLEKGQHEFAECWVWFLPSASRPAPGNTRAPLKGSAPKSLGRSKGFRFLVEQGLQSSDLLSGDQWKSVLREELVGMKLVRRANS